MAWFALGGGWGQTQPREEASGRLFPGSMPTCQRSRTAGHSVKFWSKSDGEPRTGSQGPSLLPKPLLWQHRSSMIPVSRWTLWPWPWLHGISFVHAGPVLGRAARRAGGGGHLAWEVLADRWLSGGRTFQAETNLRTAMEPTEPSGSRWVVEGKGQPPGKGSPPLLLPSHGPEQNPWTTSLPAAKGRGEDQGPREQRNFGGPYPWTTAHNLVCPKPCSRWPLMTLPVASFARWLTWPDPRWLGLEEAVAQRFLPLVLGDLLPPTWLLCQRTWKTLGEAAAAVIYTISLDLAKPLSSHFLTYQERETNLVDCL